MSTNSHGPTNGASVSRASSTALTPVQVQDAAPGDYPLTARQSLFWLDEHLFPRVPYHHVVMTVKLRGPLDVARFTRAYQETVLSFDQFRLVFFERDGEPRQAFRADFSPTLHVFDISRESPNHADPTLWAQERCVRPFDFTRALFDGALLRVAHDEHIFYFCQHHIISDGTSVGFFLSDLAKRYNNQPVAPRPSWARYVQYEQAYRKSPKSERDGRHFTQKLAHGTALKLYGRSSEHKTVGMHRSAIDGGEERWARLTQLARDPRVELIDDSVSRLVAFATVLFSFVYRVSESRSLVIGTPIPNRTAEFLDTGGLIMEQTFLAVEIEDGETFASLAAKVRKELFSGLRHGQHCVSDRGLSYVTLNLLRMPAPEFEGVSTELGLVPAPASGASLEGLKGDGRDRFGIHVFGFEREQRLKVGFDFHRSTFEPELRERAKQHFLALFDALLDNLDTPLDAVNLVSPEEARTLLDFGRGEAPATSAPDVLTQLLANAERKPRAPAMLFGAETIDYGTLLKRVGQLARRLEELGAKSESRIGVCVTRGPDEPIAMLAALWTSGAYVPLDPTHPADRIRMILEDATPDVLITYESILPVLDVPDGVRVLVLDRERDSLRDKEPINTPRASQPEQLAYVLFTSGSTGRPKGVEISRGAFANFLRSMAHTPGMTASDRLLAVTTTTFDIAGLELFLPLWVGASIQIADRETVLDPAKMRALLEREPITMMQATPTTWRLLLESGYRGDVRPLRKLCGGEAMSSELAQGLVATGGELWNMYGPTETTVWSTLKLIGEDDRRITVGRAIDATQVYVLDKAGGLLPEGVVGELCIGGLGLSRGYLSRPELTAEKFVHNPHGPAGDLIYRTGDLARFLPSGELECLGRIDHQVKIRGFRIELGEIESCLRNVPGVRDAVVVAAPRAGQDPQLIAYWMGDADREDLRNRTRAALPNYMHPALYVQLDSFPLNTNGKVDRKKLPAPREGAVRESRIMAPLDNDAMVRIAAMFRDVLGLAAVDPDEDFFALGGDSVRVIELRRRIHRTFGLELSLATMFDAPTVRRLSGALGPRVDTREPLCVTLRKGRADLPPLVCMLGVALYHPLAQALSIDRTVYGLHVPYGKKQSQGVTPSVEHVASLYLEAIRTQIPEGPYHLAGLCFGGIVAYEVARQLLAEGADVRTVSLFDAWLPRGVSRDPKARLRALLDQARKDPSQAFGQVSTMASRLAEKVRSKLGPRFAAAAQALEPEEAAEDVAPATLENDDLPVTGPLAASMLNAYDRALRPIQRPMLLFRALDRTEPDWWTLDWDLGWGQVVDDVYVHPVEGSHLGILKAPHVHNIAIELDRAMLRTEQPPRKDARSASQPPRSESSF